MPSDIGSEYAEHILEARKVFVLCKVGINVGVGVEGKAAE